MTKEQLIQNIEAMEKQGAPQEDIQEYLNSMKNQINIEATTENKKTSLFQNLGEDISKRAGNVADIFGRQNENQQTMSESILQTAGQGVGLTFDVAGRILGSAAKTGGKVLSALTPDVIETPIKEAVSKVGMNILQSPIMQEGLQMISQGIDAYKEWKKKNPRWAADLESVVNIASILPAKKIGEPITKEIGKLAGKEATKLEVKATEKGLQFIQDLVSPVKSKAVKEAEVARTTEKGTGIFKRSIIEPTISEKKMAQAVADVPELSSKATYQRNFNAIQKFNIEKAKELESTIKANDFDISTYNIQNKLNEVKSSLAENPLITGDAEKTVDKLIEGFANIIRKNYDEGTQTIKGSKLLKSRKEFDNWILEQKPNIFDAKSESALTIANKELRSGINDLLEENAPTLGIKKSLSKQSSLYRAMDNIQEKAAIEADTAIGRFLQRMEKVLGTKNRAVQILAASVGIGGLGAAATFAPAAAVTGGLGLLIWKGKKLIMRPEILMGMSNSLKTLKIIAHNEVASGITGGGVIDLIKELEGLIEEYGRE